jgi:adenosylhomocysteine nucleosidase
MIRIICALRCEAESLINYYRMRCVTKSKIYNCYTSPDADITVTISGIGKDKAAAATYYTSEYFHALKSDAWLNIGIAGHKSLEIGRAVLAHKVIDMTSDARWYPQVIFDVPCLTFPLKTLDKPSCDYEEFLFDMEAAGFYKSASCISTCELIHVLKIISDNQDQPARRTDKTVVSDLVANQMNTVNSIIDSLQELSRELAAINLPSSEYITCLERWHFSQYERTVLQKLLKRWQVLFPGVPVLEHTKSIPNGRNFIRYLQVQLQNASIQY